MRFIRPHGHPRGAVVSQVALDFCHDENRQIPGLDLNQWLLPCLAGRLHSIDWGNQPGVIFTRKFAFVLAALAAAAFSVCAIPSAQPYVQHHKHHLHLLLLPPPLLLSSLPWLIRETQQDRWLLQAGSSFLRSNPYRLTSLKDANPKRGPQRGPHLKPSLAIPRRSPPAIRWVLRRARVPVSSASIRRL